MTVVSNLPTSDSEGLSKLIIKQIFSSIGRCRFLEEKHFDACTALAGCGPAFACIFLEAMADGGVMMGLPRAEALELASQGAYSGHQHIPNLTRLYSVLFSTQRCKALLAWLYSRMRIQLRSRTPSQVSLL